MRLTLVLVVVVFLSVSGVVATELVGNSPTAPVASQASDPAAQAAEVEFGKKLFANVLTVHFVGPAMPANSDGSFGGLTCRDSAKGTMTIYEKYIVRDEFGDDGPGIRTVYAYDKLSTFEQTIGR